MTRYCECGRKIIAKLHPGRNPRSYRHRGHKALDKNHDLCRLCFKKLMTAERGKELTHG